MDKIIRGTRPRPRVALVGQFPAELLSRYQQLFPTIWHAAHGNELDGKAQPNELDLLIIGEGMDPVPGLDKYAAAVHVICFSESDDLRLPGPTPNTIINICDISKTEEYSLPPLPLSLNRRRNVDMATIDHVKGWHRLRILTQSSDDEAGFQRAVKAFKEGAVICDAHDEIPLATIFTREASNLGLAWLNSSLDQIAWVELIAMVWHQIDPDAFPSFGNWEKYPEWMVPEEISLISAIESLEKVKIETIDRITHEIGELNSQLVEATRIASEGRRRLVTAQGSALVDEVVNIFHQMGFIVEKVDEILSPDKQKREDLRLRDPDEPQAWEAIVEVRGYAKSGGQTADLQRLGRFTIFYQKEKGRLPDKRIYVVNGQTDLIPPQRDLPLASAGDDVAEFGENTGVIIWTLDLFRVAKQITPNNQKDLRESIKQAVGRWTGLSK